MTKNHVIIKFPISNSKLQLQKLKKPDKMDAKTCSVFLQIGSNKHERRRLVSGRLGGYGNSHKITFYCR